MSKVNALAAATQSFSNLEIAAALARLAMTPVNRVRALRSNLTGPGSRLANAPAADCIGAVTSITPGIQPVPIYQRSGEIIEF